jgi:preprotein translocase subunit SecG
VSSFVNVAVMIVAILLILVVLLQIREQGSGLFGNSQSTVRTRRGLEKVLFQFTIVLATIFILMAILAARFN